MGVRHKISRKNGYIFIISVLVFTLCGTVFALIYYHNQEQIAQATQNQPQSFNDTEIVNSDEANKTAEFSIPTIQDADNTDECLTEQAAYNAAKNISDIKNQIYQEAVNNREEYQVLLERAQKNQAVADEWSNQQREHLNQLFREYQESYKNTQTKDEAWANCKQAAYQRWLDNLHQ